MDNEHQAPDLNPDLVSVETRYEAQKEILLFALETQASYGRWVLASLLTVHAGGLLAITQAGASSSALFLASGRFLIGGIVCALLAGGGAWINFSISSVAYHKMLASIRTGEPYKPAGFAWKIAMSIFYVAPLVAIISLGLFIWASYAAVDILTIRLEAK